MGNSTTTSSIAGGEFCVVHPYYGPCPDPSWKIVDTFLQTCTNQLSQMLYNRPSTCPHYKTKLICELNSIFADQP